MSEVVVLLASVDALLAGVEAVVGSLLEGLVERVQSAGVGELLKEAMLTKFALSGGGAVGVFMLGHYLRKAEIIFKVLSTGGIFLMLLGALAALDVVDMNFAVLVRAVRGVLGA